MRTIPREVYLKVKNDFKLSRIQKDILVGTLLGDASLKMRKVDARLCIKHSLNQLALVENKRKIFRNIVNMGISKFSQRVGKKNYQFAEFASLTHSDFTKYYVLFYPKGKKVVPKKIRLMLEPISLAYWIMDDGSPEYSGVSIQTHSFSKKEVNLLIDVLKEKFGLESNIRRNKKHWIIYFPKKSINNLRLLIKPYLLDDYNYKLLPYTFRSK